MFLEALIIYLGRLLSNSLNNKYFFSIIILLIFINFGYSVSRKWIDISTEFKQIKKDVELAEASTAAMRAILQRLVQEQANVVELNQLTCNDIQPILNDLHQCVSINVRVNIIRMLCNLVQIMLSKNNLKDSKNYEAIKVTIFVFLWIFYPNILIIYFWQLVSTFLLDISKTETRVWVIAESIDAIMDIYAEDETDHLAADIKLIPRLLSIMPHFKSKVHIILQIYYFLFIISNIKYIDFLYIIILQIHQQKKHLQDGTVVVSTVNANLMRFIKYKQKRIGIKKKRC